MVMMRACTGEVCVRRDDVVVDIEGILRVARGMVLGQVQQLEVVVIVLDLRPFDHLVAHADEDIASFYSARYSSDAASPRRRSGPGRVTSIASRCEALLLFLRPSARPRALIQRLLQRRARFVDQLAHPRALLGGQLAHAAQQAGQFALFAPVCARAAIPAPAWT